MTTSPTAENPARHPWRAADPLTIGAFTVYPASNEISRDGLTTRLRPIVMDVLLRLAAEPGKAVTRESLIDEVWSRRIVNDEVLSRAVAELRAALTDESRQPGYIETLPKVGYRLIAPVRAVAAAPTAVGAADPPATPPQPAPPPLVSRRAALALGTIALLLGLGWTLGLGPGRWRPAPAEVGLQLQPQIAAAVPLTSDPGLELNPRFSRDGRRVVFVRRGDNAAAIVIQEIAGGKRTEIEVPGASLAAPVFFADGARIAYTKRGPAESDCGIFERRLDDGSERRLVDCARSPRALFDLSPDGRRLAYTAARAPSLPPGVFVHDLTNGQTTPLTAPEPGDGVDSAPRFSPDGTRIAFFRGSQSHSAVWLVGTAPPYVARKASQIEGQVYGLTWLDNAGPLLAAADWLGFRALHTLDLTTGEVRLLGARGARSPDIAPDGTVVFENAVFRADLWLTTTAAPGRSPRRLWPSTRYTNQAEFSPDGKQVVFASNRDGLEGLYLGSFDAAPEAGFKDGPRRLALPEGFRYIRPHWSRDGRAILATRIALGARRPAVQQAVRLHLEGNRVEVLEKLGDAVNDVRDLGGGQFLVAELTGQAMRLVRYAADFTAARLPLPVINQFDLVGNDLVYTQPQLAGATRCNLERLSCAPLDIALSDRNRFDWTLTRDAIWFLAVDERGKPALARYHLGTRQTTLADYPPTAQGTNIAVSPDGLRLILAREEPPAIDLMIAPSLPRAR